MNKIKIHPLFWFVVAAGFVTGHFYEVMMLFTIVFVHEMGHGAAARFFHWRIEKIELLPFGGVAQTDEHGNRPLAEEVIVILAGPAQHLLLYAVGLLLYYFSILDVQDYQAFLRHNTTILVFNLLPVWPLDGGRLLRVLCSFSYPFKEAIKKSLLFSTILLALMSLWSAIYYPLHLNLWCVMAFLGFAHFREWKQRYYLYMRFLMGRYYDTAKSQMKLEPITVNAEEKLNDVLARFHRGVYHTVIVKNRQHRTVFEEKDLLHAFFEENQISRPVGEL
ncbi:MAG TPA: M50 family metallopeptidase [Bacillales bacterium]|nr:M50 family metallopeptidase [Bacillales bacterium]